MNTTILIHLGYMKTASTWLQKSFFIPRSGYQAIATLEEIRNEIIYPKECVFNYTLVQDKYSKRIEEIRRSGLVPVLSHERLSGNPMSGCWDNFILAQRLHKLFPESKILLVIREQESILYSIYQQYVKEGGSCTLESFLFPPYAAKIPLFDESSLCYNYLIDKYNKEFGDKAVMVQPYEVMKNDLFSFLEKIHSFSENNKEINIKSLSHENVSLQGAVVRFKPYINRLMVYDNINPSPLFRLPRLAKRLTRMLNKLPSSFHEKSKNKLKTIIKEYCVSRYSCCNKLAQKHIQENLTTLGYS